MISGEVECSHMRVAVTNLPCGRILQQYVHDDTQFSLGDIYTVLSYEIEVEDRYGLYVKSYYEESIPCPKNWEFS